MHLRSHQASWHHRPSNQQCRYHHSRNISVAALRQTGAVGLVTKCMPPRRLLLSSACTSLSKGGKRGSLHKSAPHISERYSLANRKPCSDTLTQQPSCISMYRNASCAACLPSGMQATGPLVEQPLEYFQQVMDTNVTGAVRMTQAVVPAMLARVRRGNEYSVA